MVDAGVVAYLVVEVEVAVAAAVVEILVVSRRRRRREDSRATETAIALLKQRHLMEVTQVVINQYQLRDRLQEQQWMLRPA